MDSDAPLQPRVHHARAEVRARGVREVHRQGCRRGGQDLRLAQVLLQPKAHLAAQLQRQAPRAERRAVQADQDDRQALLRRAPPEGRHQAHAWHRRQGWRGRPGSANSRRDSQHHAPQRHQGEEGHLDGGMAPEAPQQHHPGRHHHLRGLPRLPQVQHGHLRVLARSLRGRHRPRSPRILRASHPRRAHAASHQESGAHQGLPELSEDPKVRSLRRGPHRVHQDGKQGSRRRQPRAQLREGRAERRRRRHPAPRRVRRREARAPRRGSRQPFRPGVDSRAPLPRPLPVKLVRVESSVFQHG